MEGSELFRNAEQWLTDNPGKNLADYRKETNYSGPALKTRHRKGEPVRVSYKGKSSESQTRRVTAETPKTSEEAAAVRRVKRQARQQTGSTLHQHASGGRPSIAEHDVRLASGGTNEFMSISDPDFKSFKDTLEQKTARMFGDQYVVDIDEVSGYPRVVESKYHNKFQPVSRQPGVTIEPGMNIDRSLLELQKRAGMRAAVSGSAADILRMTGKRAFSFIPFVGVGFDAENLATKTARAAKTKDPLDTVQAGLAGAAMEQRAVGLGAGIADTVMDVMRTPSKPVTDEDLDFSTM